MEYTGPKINGVPTQSIAKRSGIPVNMISKLCGVNATSIGLPGHFTGPTCMTIDATYNATSIEAAYFGGVHGTQLNKTVDLDDTNGALYLAGSCGNDTKYAPTGYYALQIPTGDVAPEGMPLPTYTAFAYWNDVELMLDTSVTARLVLSLTYSDTQSSSLCTSTDVHEYYYFIGPIINPNKPDKRPISLMTIVDGTEINASAGYYSDGVTIYSNLFNDKFEQLVFLDTEVPCIASGPTMLTAPTWELVTSYNNAGQVEFLQLDQTTFEITSELLQTRANDGVVNGGGSFSVRADRGSWSGTGTLSYFYEWLVDDSVVFTDGPWPRYNPKNGEYDDFPQTSYWFGLDELGKTFKYRVTVTDDTGSTSASLSLQIVDPVLDRFLLNSGISGSQQVAALKYLRKEMLTTRFSGVWFNFDSVLKDYYPVAGSTENENKWSLKNPNHYLNFRSNPGSSSYLDNNQWTHSSNGMHPTYTSIDNYVESTFSTTYVTSNTDIDYGFFFGLYSGDNVVSTGINLGVVTYEDMQVAGFVLAAYVDSTSDSYASTCGSGKVSRFLYNPKKQTVGWRTACVPLFYSQTMELTTYGAKGLNGLVVRDLSWSASDPNIRVSEMLEGRLIDYYSIATSTEGLNSAASTSPIRLGGLNTDKNIQFVIAGQLPPSYYGEAYYMNILNTILKNYNTMLGR